MAVAKIALMTNGTYTDGLYSYLVPPELAEDIEVGSSVVVPFGRSNKPVQAIVIEIINETDLEDEKIEEGKIVINEKGENKSYELKKIISLSFDEPILSDFQIKLCSWIRDRYISTFSEAVRLMYPRGLKFVSRRKITRGKNFKEYFDDDKEKLKEDNYIIKTLIYSDEVILDEISNSDLRIIKNLEKKEILELGWDYEESLNEKTYNLISLIKNWDKGIRLGKAQKRIVDFLSLNESISEKDLKDLLEVSSQSIKSLHEKGVINIEKRDFFRRYEINKIGEYKDGFELTPYQKEALEKIKSSKKPVVFRGVTGSGKTEVYIELLRECLREQKGGIILVPEIGLTPQTVHRFKKIFGEEVVVYHSKLSEGEKHDAYRLVKSGACKVVIGTRSSIFLPIKDLKLIVIDECHDSSYKSESNPKYRTEEVAYFISKHLGARLVLGSATPSMEQYYRANSGEYTLVNLLRRANNKDMPKIEVVDMKEEVKSGNTGLISSRLYEVMKRHLEEENQVILFLNRRGFSNFIYCSSCGAVVKCDRCDISMTYHKFENKLKCHYCEDERSVPTACPECGKKSIILSGAGTQKIEDELIRMFPDKVVRRYDRDSVSKKGDQDKVLRDFGNGDIDILVGTQMLAKGLDFKNVTLAGILSGDMMLSYPDYKASENTFSLITQVAGRPGRAEKKGEVVLQAFQTDHHAIRYATDYDYESFYEKEIDMRRKFGYPPFNNIVRVVVTGEDYTLVRNDAFRIKEVIVYLLTERGMKNIDFIYGPSQCAIEKIKSKYRWQLLLRDRGIDIGILRGLIKYICVDKKDEVLSRGNYVSIDINPENLV